MQTVDPYYTRSEVSNSDLTALKKLLYGGSAIDPTQAYAFGNLIDAMITEHHKVDYYNRSLNGYIYTVEEFENAKKMKAAFCKDPFCAMILQQCSFQHVSIQPEFKIYFNGFEFILPARCKWDFIFDKSLKMGGDIKSTAAETQAQFETACHFFDYFRSRAWYMDIEGTDKDILIGISKVNRKLFKITLDKTAPLGTKARDLYELGKSQYQDLAFKYWMLMYGLKIPA